MKKIIFIIAMFIIGSINLNMEAADRETSLQIGIIDDNDDPISITQNRWFSSMYMTEVYDHNYEIAVGFRGFKMATARAQVGFIGNLYKCGFHFFDTCDTNQQKFVPKSN
jgi:hypothetical protein